MADRTIASDIASDLADEVVTLVRDALRPGRYGSDATGLSTRMSPDRARTNAIDCLDQVGHAALATRRLTVALRLALSSPSDFDDEEHDAMLGLASLLQQELDGAVDNVASLMAALGGLSEAAAA